MLYQGPAKKVTIYASERAQYHLQPLHNAILTYLLHKGVAGATAGRGSVPSYPAVEAAVRALAHVVEYAVWLRVPQTTVAEPGVNDLDAARHLVNEVLMRHPEGRDLDFDEQNRLLRSYGIDLWDTYAVASLDEATTAGEALGWDVVLKATAEHLRQRPDLAIHHFARRMLRGGSSIATRSRPSSSANRWSNPGSRTPGKRCLAPAVRCLAPFSL